ncbi:ATP-binding protein [Patescibacteria group bacterium]|nr:ATP-binding protein [Patescibacteria group bacterium]MBU4579719.1 ATP-binding protein [Patescibacteria group bacterium]
MNKNELIKILEDWNFWKKDLKVGLIRSSYLDVLEERLSSEQIKVIIGARRSGKSYIMRQLAKWIMEKKGVSKNNILIINFEDPRFTGLDTKLIQEAFDVYLETYKPKGEIYVFLDEIQEVSKWEKWVRTMQELGKANMIISGSNSKLLSSELATVLTGRHLDMTVMPLSFVEFLKFKGLEIKNTLDLVRNEIESKSLLKEFLEFGSFPLVVLGQDKKNILLSYFDDVVNKDLIKRYKIRKTEEIKSLIKFYLSNIASPVTFTSSGKFLNISTLTVERFSVYLEAVYAVFFLKRFSYKFKEQEKSPRKVYAVDTGVANTIGFRFSPNLGRLAENTVFLELKRRAYLNPFMEIYYWKSLAGEEVDFVLKEDTKVNELIQVCWNMEDINTKKREVRALLKAMKEFKLNSGLIITEDYEGEESFSGKTIRYISLRKWLLGLSAK